MIGEVKMKKMEFEQNVKNDKLFDALARFEAFDYEGALEILLQLSEEGCVHNRFIGECYEKLGYYRKANKLSDIDSAESELTSKILLANLYEKREENRAKLLYLEVLKEMYVNNNPNCYNQEIVMNWCLKQAEQGDVLAQFYIGWLYSHDSEHLDDARFWLEKADAQGNVNAFILLDKLNISDFMDRYPDEFRSPDDDHIGDDELPF